MELTEFEACVTTYSDMVYRIAYGQCGSQMDAEDIYQEVFMKLYDYKKSFNDEEHRKHWLIRVTINECRSLFRSPWIRRRQSVEDINQVAEERQKVWMSWGKDGHRTSDEMKNLLNEIPKKYRTILYLYYYEEYSTKEISAILKRNESTIRTQLARGREVFRRLLEDTWSIRSDQQFDENTLKSSEIFKMKGESIHE